ncbi:hypothetical protein [Sinorhizobium chiapasense]|uniref:Uncharacterized protein n=1 Tax=Sinorhizobium chiapasense TaxID=501572 RepID=A0ABZ2BHB9_9HYPH
MQAIDYKVGSPTNDTADILDPVAAHEASRCFICRQPDDVVTAGSQAWFQAAPSSL